MGRDAHWLNEERLRVYPRLFLTLFTLAALAYAATFRNGVDFAGRPPGADFVTFWAASSLVLEGRALDVFDPSVMQAREVGLFPGATGMLPWFYPPPTLLLVAPLAWVPYALAFISFALGSLGAFLASLRPLVFAPQGWWLVAAFPGLWLSLAQGQPSLLTAALAGSGFQLRENRPILAGVLIGLLAVKPQLALLLPLLLIVERRWTAFGAAAASASAFLAASLLILGPTCLDAWLGSLNVAATAMQAGAFKMIKIPTIVAWLFASGLPLGAALAIHTTFAVLAAAAFVDITRRRPPAGLTSAACVLATFIVLPYSFDYDLAWLAFPIAWLAAEGLQHGWGRGDRELLVALWVLPLVLGAAGLLHVPVGPAVLMWGLVQVWRRARAQTPSGRRPAPEASGTGAP